MQGHRLRDGQSPGWAPHGETETKAESNTLTNGVTSGETLSLEKQGRLFSKGPCGLRYDCSSSGPTWCVPRVLRASHCDHLSSLEPKPSRTEPRTIQKGKKKSLSSQNSGHHFSPLRRMLFSSRRSHLQILLSLLFTRNSITARR